MYVRHAAFSFVCDKKCLLFIITLNYPDLFFTEVKSDTVLGNGRVSPELSSTNLFHYFADT